ncbi:hypothetical protein Prubr_50430 [Polymorphospora rubra]|uniref:AAA+ ATPase domain-containing protein n=1 Tax=Polymorphospora rubra TaxID=338584 RepID=A0A810N3H8_9ACTN|nr:hypothetical protein Prubr_50430 [Polymorphospora rubra]
MLAAPDAYWIAVAYLGLPASQGGIRSDPVPPAQLPAANADFTGRERELTDLRERCKAGGPRLIVVSGAPGVGKSALIVRLAGELRSSFPDGQLYADLRGADRQPLTAGFVLGLFLGSLGVDAIPDDLEARVGAYRTMLANRRMLVVLDNATSEAQVRALVPAAEGCLVLVTSRSPLPALDGAEPYCLGALDPDESFALLGAVAGPGRMDSDPDGCYAIVRHCGGLPLAVRIAAGRLRARSDWTPTHLAQRLADTRRRLDVLHIGDLDVRACFDLSYRDLDAESGCLFRRLSVIPGPTFSTELAAALVGLPTVEAEELLDRLVLDQLVTSAGAPGYYTMHDLLWLFATDCFKEAGDDAQHHTTVVLDWYARWLVRANTDRLKRISRDDWWAAPDQPLPAEEVASVVAWLDAEAINLNAVLRCSDRLGLDRYTATCAVPVSRFAHRRGLGVEWAEAIDIGLTAARRSDDSVAQIRLLFERGELFASSGQWEQAVMHWGEAVELTDDATPPDMVGTLHTRLAHTYIYLGLREDSEREIAAARDAFAKIDPALASLSYAVFRSGALGSAGQTEDAVTLLERDVIPNCDRLSFHSQVEVRSRLANSYSALGRHVEALQQLRICLNLCRDHGLRAIEPVILLLLGEEYEHLGIQGRAVKLWEEGLVMAHQEVYPATAGVLAMRLGRSRFASGDLAGARELFAKAVDGFGTAVHAHQRAIAWHSVASAQWRLGKWDDAEAAWTWAFAALQEYADRTEGDRYRRSIEQARAALKRASEFVQNPPQVGPHLDL